MRRSGNSPARMAAACASDAAFFAAECGQHNGPVRAVIVYIGRGQPLSGLADVLAVFKRIALEVLLCNKDRHARDGQLMHADAAAARVRFALQIAQAGLRAGILRVCGIVRPRDTTSPGRTKAQTLSMCSFVSSPSMPRGSHRTFFCTEHAAQHRGDLVLREVRIAPGTQKAGLCDEQRALAVAVDGAALHHERRGIIAAEAERIQQAARKGIVPSPGGRTGRRPRRPRR